MDDGRRVKRILSFIEMAKVFMAKTDVVLLERLKSKATELLDKMQHSNDHEGSSSHDFEHSSDNAIKRLISETEELASQLLVKASPGMPDETKEKISQKRPILNSLMPRENGDSVPFEDTVKSDNDIIQKLRGVISSNTKAAPSYNFSKEVIGIERGVVVGNLQYYEGRDKIDCSCFGTGGKGIPRLMHRVTGITSEALFILVVENETAFLSLTVERFYERIPCIIVTSNGNPGVASGLFVRKLKMELNIPVYALIDCDNKGIKLMLLYRFGSNINSTKYLDVEWLGLRPSDLNSYGIPDICRIKMSESDLQTANELFADAVTEMNIDLAQELTLMINMKRKAELEVLCNFGIDYLTQVYLPLKLQQI